MKLLVDSHALIWSILNDHRLSPRAKRIFREGTDELSVSIVSLWELSIKIAIGKLRTIGSSVAYLRDECEEYGIQIIPLSTSHILRAEALPLHHRDPFDRLLIGQALEEGLSILTNDAQFRSYPVKVVW